MNKRVLGAIVGVALVVGSIVLVVVIDRTPKIDEEPQLIRPLKTFLIESAVARSTKVYPGRVEASQRVDLAFRVSGPLIELPITAGQNVVAGSVIARIDPRDFQIRLDDVTSRIDEAMANFEAMQRGRPEDISSLRAEVQKKEAALSLATSEYENMKIAFDRGAANELELLQRQEKHLRSKSELQQANENLRISESGARPEDIEAAQAALRGLEAQHADAQAAFNDSQLLAPFTGVIATRYVENFEYVDIRQPIVSLQDVSIIEIIINVPESDLLTRTEENEYIAFASFEGAHDQAFELALKEFATDADPVTQTYEATLTMPSPDGINILPGMTATVRAYPRQPSDGESEAFAIPMNAVPVDGTGNYFVWKLTHEDGDIWVVHRVDVDVGDLAGDTIVVTQGIGLGDRIAAAGIKVLREGQRVRLLSSDESDES